MCRNIKTTFNSKLPARKVEIRDASLQFVLEFSEMPVPRFTSTRLRAR